MIIAIVVVVGLAVLLVVVGSGVVQYSRRRERVRATREPQLVEAMAEAEWVRDTLSVEVINRDLTDPDQIETMWTSSRGRVNDLTAELERLAVSMDDPRDEALLRRLAGAVDGVASAIDGDVSLRTHPAGADIDQAAALQESADTVTVSRDALAAAIADVQRVH